MLCYWLGRWRKGPQGKGCGWAPESGKDKKTDSSLEPPEEMLTPWLWPLSDFWPPEPWDKKSGHCKPLSSLCYSSNGKVIQYVKHRIETSSTKVAQTYNRGWQPGRGDGWNDFWKQEVGTFQAINCAVISCFPLTPFIIKAEGKTSWKRESQNFSYHIKW